MDVTHSSHNVALLENEPSTTHRPGYYRESSHGSSAYLFTHQRSHDTLDAAVPRLENLVRRKPFARIGVLAVIISLACLALGCITISPNLGLAWHLQYTGQIVVIGFLLGIMNICMQKTLPYGFLLLEARFGRSPTPELRSSADWEVHLF